MPMHTIRQGECLSSLAARYHLADWHHIYHHPRNAAFRQLRPDPNLVYIGDTLFIPDREVGRESGATETCHRFRLIRPTTYLRLLILDTEDHPAADSAYTLRIGQESSQGRSDTNGLIEFEIGEEIENATLTVEVNNDERYTWTLLLGHLDPLEELSGVQARLNNLGYSCAVDGRASPETEAALRRFQEDQELNAEGQLDDATRSRLGEVYGC